MLFLAVSLDSHLLTDDDVTGSNSSVTRVKCGDCKHLQCVFTNVTDQNLLNVTCSVCDVTDTCVLNGQTEIFLEKVQIFTLFFFHFLVCKRIISCNLSNSYEMTSFCYFLWFSYHPATALLSKLTFTSFNLAPPPFERPVNHH